MRSILQKFLPALSLVLVVIAVTPYKFPRSPRSLSRNEILVSHAESTCTADFYVKRGQLIVPKELQSALPGWQSEFTIDDAGWTPFDAARYHQSYWLVARNEFILSGEVTGIDSSAFGNCQQVYPVFRIDSWSPTAYRPNILSFGPTLTKAYFIAVAICLSPASYC